MIIARAAKGAALLLMIFGVVALIGCPAATGGSRGPAGTAGKDGEPGAKGDPGATGPAALQAKGGTGTYNILINNGGTDTVPAVGDVTKPASSADVTELFTGGTAPITYAISGVTGNPFTASLKDNVIVVGKRTGSAGNLVSPDSYTTGTTLTVTATDANDVSATKSVAIVANRKPVAFRADDHATRNVVVGTQSETYGTGTTAKKARNVVHILDLRSYSAAAATPGTPNAYFTDDGPDSGNFDADLRDHTVELTRMTRGGDNDPKKAAEHIQVEITAGANGIAANGLKITGLKSTWDSSLDTPAHVPVVVTLTATDPGGLKQTNTITVYVDGAPQVATAPPAVHSKRATGTATILIRDLDSFYKDPEKASGTGLTAVDGDLSWEPRQITGVALDSGNLQVTPNNQGKATITYIIGSDHVGLPAIGGRALAASYLGSAGSIAVVDRDGDGTGDTTASGIFTQYIQGTVTLNVTP